MVVVSLGATRNTEWPAGSGFGAGPRQIACDAGCRAFDFRGIVADDIFVAGDVARSPHPLFGYQFLSLEHWGNSVTQAEVAAHNMISAGTDRRPHMWVPGPACGDAGCLRTARRLPRRCVPQVATVQAHGGVRQVTRRVAVVGPSPHGAVGADDGRSGRWGRGLRRAGVQRHAADRVSGRQHVARKA